MDLKSVIEPDYNAFYEELPYVPDKEQTKNNLDFFFVILFYTFNFINLYSLRLIQSLDVFNNYLILHQTLLNFVNGINLSLAVSKFFKSA